MDETGDRRNVEPEVPSRITDYTGVKAGEYYRESYAEDPESR